MKVEDKVCLALSTLECLTVLYLSFANLHFFYEMSSAQRPVTIPPNPLPSSVYTRI